MSQEQQQALLADFASWSGGFTPDECTPEEIQTYVEASHQMDSGISQDDALAFLQKHESDQR